MNKTLFLALAALFFQTPSYATPAHPRSEKAGSEAVALGGQVAAPERAVQVYSVGKGIRKKKIALFSVQVYEAELFVSNLSVFNKGLLEGPALDALAKMKNASIRLKFLRTLHSDQVKESFSEALKVNQVDPTSAKMTEFFTSVAKTETFAEGKGVSISADLVNGVLTYEGPEGKTNQIQGDTKFMLALFSIWLGVPADGGLAALKEALLKPTGSG